jgi:hypothetical protein
MNCEWEMQDKFRCFGIGIFHELFIEIGLMDESWGYHGIFTTDGCGIHPSSVSKHLCLARHSRIFQGLVFPVSWLLSKMRLNEQDDHQMSPVETRKPPACRGKYRTSGVQTMTCSWAEHNDSHTAIMWQTQNCSRPPRTSHMFFPYLNLERIGSYHCCLVVVSNLQDVGTFFSHRPAPRVARFVCTSGDHVRSKTTYSMLGRQVDS